MNSSQRLKARHFTLASSSNAWPSTVCRSNALSIPAASRRIIPFPIRLCRPAGQAGVGSGGRTHQSRLGDHRAACGGSIFHHRRGAAEALPSFHCLLAQAGCSSGLPEALCALWQTLFRAGYAHGEAVPLGEILPNREKLWRFSGECLVSRRLLLRASALYSCQT